MKKTFLLAAMLLMAMCVKSQDTIWDASLSALSTNYMVNEDTWMVSDTGKVSQFPGSSTHTLFGKYFFTKDQSLRIYGIAAMLEPMDLHSLLNNYGYTLGGLMIDSTLDKAFELVGIYAAGSDSIALYSEQKRIHVRDSVPAYYLGTNMYNPHAGRETEIHPVYEVFFDEPVEVSDSFYVAMTRESWRMLDDIDAPRDSLHRIWSAWPIGTFAYFAYYSDSTLHLRMDGDRVVQFIPTRGWVYEQYPSRSFLFPILTPRAVDTTTTVDTTTVDTVGIATLRTVERYVNLLPNPASERVQVTSSFGLRGIEVYNAAGVKVQEQRAVGYTATLDISALPEGSYLVRVATPSGTVTKKLVVQRR